MKLSSQKNQAPKRDAAGKFTSGSGGLSSLKKIKLRRVLPILLVVSLVGGYLVYRSFASTVLANCHQFEQRCLVQSRQSTVVRLYYTSLNRAPSEGDIRYWVGRLNGTTGSKLSTAQVAQYFITSKEFKQRYGSLSGAVTKPSAAGNAQLANTFYQQAYNQGASSTAIKNATAQLNNRNLTPAALVAQLVESTAVKQSLLNKVAVVLGVKEKPLCLSRGSDNVNVTASQNLPYRNVKIPQNSVINATTANWNGKRADGSAITWATIVDGGDGSCWYGGRFFGAWDDRSSSVTWENPYHHSAGMTIRSDNFLVEGLRVNNQGDGINIAVGAKDFHIRNVYVSDIHDDCVQNDGFASGVTEGSLFDGCYSGFSAESDSGSGPNHTWRIENNLLRMKPFYTIYKPEKYLARGCKIPSHHGLFKGWSSTKQSPKVILKNNIFRADQDSCARTLDIPPNMNLAQCSNNTFVWLGKGPFPYTLPKCFKVTTDKSVWDKAVAQWKQTHPSVGW